MPKPGEIEHDSRQIYYRSPVGAAEAGSIIRIGIQVKTRETLSILLRTWSQHDGEKLVNMHTNEPIDAPERYYFADVQLPERGCLVWYYFIISSPSGTQFYGNSTDNLGGMGILCDNVPSSFQITVYDKGAKTPDWFKHSVMYQIFPDRFCRKGDKLVKKHGAVIHADWNDMPFYYKDVDTKEIVAYDFFGGNLEGIRSKLGYLKNLGISVIYLNPVFESESNHHYDTGDYMKIDPILGDEEGFKKLCDEARSMGIRIIIDGVFSHTGSNSVYFNRNGEYDSVGAYNSQDSPYYGWYNFRNYPDEYESWWNFSTLPDVKETTPSYMDFIIRNKDSVLHHWMKAGISGWRLDVIDELPGQFSQAFFKEMKKTDPDAVLIGEVWEDASNKVSYGTSREYLCGHEIDSAMNYPFRQIVLDFLLGGCDGRMAMRRLESLRENYPKQNFYAMMNLLGSHDVQRILTLLGEAPYYDGMPAIQQSKYRLDDDHYNLGVARLRMAVMWQMTYPGVPCVYYGDEIGMQGFKDPSNRAPYNWEHGDTYIRNWYEKLIRLRNEHPALQTGEILPIVGDGDVLSYARIIRGGEDVFGEAGMDEAFIIAINRSEKSERTGEVVVSDFADGEFMNPFKTDEKLKVEHGKVRLQLPPLGCQIWQLEKPKHRFRREAGILLHPTSLPSKYGIGDIGKTAFKFVDFLKRADQHVWQMLPLGPVMFTYSPYQSSSAFAGNPMLISLDKLVENGLLHDKDVRVTFIAHSSFVDFERAWNFKEKALKKAYQNFVQKGMDTSNEFRNFCDIESYWLDDFALFESLKADNKGKCWMEWPEKVRDRDKKVLERAREQNSEDIGFIKFEQFVFFTQWEELHEYANKNDVKLMGDMPIFIAQDSADVWAHQESFMLNPDGTAKTVSGVPPDYFSATGQLWGNPQYNWDVMKKDGYMWWKQRFTKLYELVDIVRVDHFRGFESYWEIDGKAKTAINGRWVKGPGKKFFDEIQATVGKLPIVAEDLGIITDEVEKLKDECGFPGMKVLHFMLHFNEMKRVGAATPENSIVYTGTHDNNTTVGWFTQDIDDATAAGIAAMLHADMHDPRDVTKKLISYAYSLNSGLAVIPMQDVLGLDAQSRMNTPATVGINWKWCLKEDLMTDDIAEWLKSLCKKYDRE